ncbi:hypothetical protein [Paenibacillus dauci]|uniref:hypothetical protein n=1 Tax=Paenibacillus dauci TaxID=1567106 RepID=UPI0006197ED0|nr:hypothetical protein [Paenibacillus dauci]
MNSVSTSKKKYFIFLLILIIAVVAMVFIAAKLNTNTLKDTDLSNVTIYHIKPGESLNQLEKDQYGSRQDLLPQKNSYHFKNFSVTYNDQKIITAIQTTTDEGNQHFEINNTPISNLDNAVTILGENYGNTEYDSEQGLSSRDYTDQKHGIQLSLIYSKNQGNYNALVWVIIKSIDQPQ